jgi:hypothetical protein
LRLRFRIISLRYVLMVRGTQVTLSG